MHINHPSFHTYMFLDKQIIKRAVYMDCRSKDAQKVHFVEVTDCSGVDEQYTTRLHITQFFTF